MMTSAATGCEDGEVIVVGEIQFLGRTVLHSSKLP
jgi:hypothetical protein